VVLTTDDAHTIAKLSNEYATVWVDLDREDANGPRLLVRSLRDHGEVYLDPVALSLLCELDQQLLSLLADIARDEGAREEFHAWMASRGERLVLPEDLA
jgi:hypothetical protein